MNKKTYHFHFCRIKSDHDKFSITYGSTRFQIELVGAEFDAGKGMEISWEEDGDKDIEFLQWFSVYLGEDLINPFQEVDTRFSWHRGNFVLDPTPLQKFMTIVHRVSQSKKTPKWKSELRDNSIMYYLLGVNLGERYMPMSIGFFALSLECIGNYKYGKRDKHWTLGERKFLAFLTEAIMPLKKNPETRDVAKVFEKRINADLALLNELRNAFYGHSLMHLAKDKQRVVKSLRDWMIRSGFSKKQIAISMPFNDVKSGIMSNIPALFKLGLRLNRLFLFLSVGISDPPFASHDFKYLGDHVNGEISRHRGVQITSSFNPGESKGSFELKLEISAYESKVKEQNS